MKESAAIQPNIAARLLGFVCGAIGLANVYALRLADADLWGHLRYGRYFVESDFPPAADRFSYTAQGLTWHTHEYLAQIILWLVYATGGAPGGTTPMRAARRPGRRG